jgi:CelD/BcsL family acetyltransferase involved in cellulose biosynthesis
MCSGFCGREPGPEDALFGRYLHRLSLVGHDLVDFPSIRCNAPRMTATRENLRVTERYGLGGLLSLRSDWTRLAQVTGHYFHEFGWFLEQLRHDFRPAADYRFLVVERGGGEVIGIVPLEQRVERIRRIPFTIWSLAGSRLGDVMMLSSGSDLLCASREAAPVVLAAAIRHLRSARPRCALLLAGRVLPGSMAHGACLAYPGAAHFSRGAVDWVPTDRAWADLLAGLSAGFRANLRNITNRARALGAVEFRLSTRGSPDLEVAFADFMRVEAAGWKASGPKPGALEVNPFTSQRDFLRAVFFGEQGCVPEVHRMLIDGKCIAAALAVRHQHTLAILKIGHDERYRRLGAGHQLVANMLERCCDDAAIRWVDFVSHTAWVGAWAPAVQPHHFHYLPIRPLVAALPLALLRLPARARRPARAG